MSELSVPVSEREQIRDKLNRVNPSSALLPAAGPL